jgi:putative ABC transport system substrate-binding protein
MNRRAFVTGLGVVVVAPIVANAEQAGRVPRIGVLFNVTRDGATPLIKALEKGLYDRGYVEGRNIAIEYRFGGNKPERLPEFAAELAALNVDVIVVGIDRTATVARLATSTIPIVMAVGEDPIGAGLIESVAHPGGNVTGVAVGPGPEILGKNVELLAEALPRGVPIAVLYNTESRIHSVHVNAIQDTARKLGVTLVLAGVRRPEEFDSAFRLIKQRRAAGVTVLGESWFYANRSQLQNLAARNGLADMWLCPECIGPGGLMAYGVNVPALYERAATYVDKILKGAKPADLPIEQPTKFELVINLKTAKALGLTIPPSLLQRADQVIE